jgi:polyvinyl alcohol dehydrogenase (cytochrome)
MTSHGRTRTQWRGLAVAGGLALAVAASLLAPLPAGAVASAEWPAFLAGRLHASTNADATFTTANATSLTPAWTFTAPKPTVLGQPGGGFDASPVVADGMVFIGGLNGILYALDETNGHLVWKHMLGWVPKLSCYADGITATATVAADPTSGKPTVYAAGGSGKLFAIDAGSGTVLWKKRIFKPSATENDYYQWSAPTVANGKVYIGVSSMCDQPLVRGGVRSFSQTDGSHVAAWYGVPKGQTGATVWSSVAATPKAVYVTTGNGEEGTPNRYYEDSIVKLNPTTLKLQASFTLSPDEIVPDGDFGASPTMFKAGTTRMVGACNKNGIFYALTAGTLTPVWERRIAAKTTTEIPTCVSSAVWDGSRLFVAAAKTTIDGTPYRGSIRELDPATGMPVWETGLGGKVIGNPSLNGADVLGVPMRDSPAYTRGVQLIDATDGSPLAFADDGKVFAQPVFADGHLFVANETSKLSVFTPG